MTIPPRGSDRTVTLPAAALKAPQHDNPSLHCTECLVFIVALRAALPQTGSAASFQELLGEDFVSIWWLAVAVGVGSGCHMAPSGRN